MLGVIDLMKKNKSFREIDLNTHISLKNQYVFFQVSKVASSTIKEYLQKIELEGTGRRIINVNDRNVSPHVWPSQLSLNDFESILIDNKFKKIAFVRNPYTRTLSCYLHRIVKEPKSPSNTMLRRYTGGLCGPEISFSDFVKVICEQDSIQQESHWRRQYDEIFFDLISDWSFIGRFESLSDDMERLKSILFENKRTIEFESSLNMSPMKTNASDKIKSYYDDATQELLYNSFRQDFEAFGYSKEI